MTAEPPVIGFTFWTDQPGGFADVWGRVWPGHVAANPCAAGRDGDPGPHPTDRGLCEPGCGIVGFARPEDLVAARHRTTEDTNPMAFALATIFGGSTALPGLRDGVFGVVALDGRIVDDGDGDHWAERARVVAAVWHTEGSPLLTTRDPELIAAHFAEHDPLARRRLPGLWDEVAGDAPPPEHAPSVVAARLHRLAAACARDPGPALRARTRARLEALRRDLAADAERLAAWQRGAGGRTLQVRTPPR